LPSTCYKVDAALAQLEMTYLLRKNGTRAEFSKTLADRMIGMFQTSWMNSRDFISAYHGGQASTNTSSTVDTFKALFAEIRKNSA